LFALFFLLSSLFLAPSWLSLSQIPLPFGKRVGWHKWGVKLPSRTGLTICVQRNHLYKCDKQHVVKHDLTYTCLASLHLRMEAKVRQHCKIEGRPIQEMMYLLTDTEHLVYSPKIQIYKIICTNSTSETMNLDLANKVHIPKNCHIN
jgi:hypothetical protein